MKAKRNNVEQGMFKDLKTSNIIMGSLKELYKRYSLDFWVVIASLEFIYIVWRALS